MNQTELTCQYLLDKRHEHDAKSELYHKLHTIFSCDVDMIRPEALTKIRSQAYSVLTKIELVELQNKINELNVERINTFNLPVIPLNLT